MKPIITSLLMLVAAHLPAQTAPVDTAASQTIRDWQALRYGMFIHFGMSTFIANEYGTGKERSDTYAPTRLDVDQWIRVAKDAGMKYAVLTSKHVAGHCLWDSKVQFRGREFDHDVTTSGNKTDVVAEFVKACKKHGITPGLYWCLLDFRNNSVPSQQQWSAGRLPDDFSQLAQDQFTELIQRYPDIGYYWIDIPRAASAGQRRELYDLIKRLRPGTVVLFNHGTNKPRGPMTIANYQAALPTDVLNTERWPLQPGWFTPGQEWQGRTYQLGYEHCDTICQNWFWIEGDRPRPVRELIRLYRDTLAAGGNLLLNVPPDRTGRIPEYHISALMELKRAMDDPAPFPSPLNLNAITRASNVYRNDPNYRAAFAVDDNITTRWATDDGIKSAWLEVDFGKPVTFGRAVIQQAYPELKRVRKFAIEYLRGDKWTPCYQGQNPGATLDVEFAPVTAQRVRLNATECTDGPTVWEFQLFPTTGNKP